MKTAYLSGLKFAHECSVQEFVLDFSPIQSYNTISSTQSQPVLHLLIFALKSPNPDPKSLSSFGGATEFLSKVILIFSEVDLGTVLSTNGFILWSSTGSVVNPD